MKNYTFTILIGWLFFLSSNLFAQNPEGLFRLKEGDWFEVQAEINSTATQNQPLNNPLQKQTNCETYLLNYQLQKQLHNGSQLYQIRLEHFKATKKFDRYYLGYDSYYPEFEENKTGPEVKNLYNLQVNPNGKVVYLTSLKKNKSRVNYTSIKSAYGGNYSITYSEQMIIDSLMIRIISNALMLPDSSLKKVAIAKDRRIPYLIQQPDMKLHLTNASFPLPDNAIIQGQVKDQSNQEVKISLKGENSDYYFPGKRFLTNRDGSFNCPIFLKRPFHLRIQVGNKTLTTFMEPGDTLNITAIGHQSREIEYNQYANTKPKEYFSPNLKKSDYFTGSAAYNTMLSNELDQYRNGYVYENKISTAIINWKKTAESVNELLGSYRRKASDECIRYFESDFKYLLAVAKLYHYENHLTSDWEDYQNNKILKGTRTFSGKDYPTDFFLEVDTMSILMNPNEWNSSYQNFIYRAQQFKQNRLGWAIGKKSSGIFFENYSFAQVSLQGYPLYSQIAKLLDTEMRKGQIETNRLTQYYQDFINNCADPALTGPLKKVYETAMQLKIGNTFPIKSFVLQNSSIFNMEKMKGKPICLIFMDAAKSYIAGYKEEILKFKGEEVEFIIARIPSADWRGGKLDSTILKLPNVTYIELTDKNLISKLLLKRNKIFMLDKWFRIVENDAEDPAQNKYLGGKSKFEKSLRNAIEAKRFSKAEKTAMLKTAGWSFGSILFTLVIGLWIYRIRIRRIKQQEAAKRRMKELEIKAIRSQMNPHFIFNALNSIQSLINGNQFKEANIYLSKFAVLLRGVLNNSEKSRISLSDELQAVELYCQLEQLRFEFKFEISIDPEVNGDLIEIPGMIIQPLAENAVVHGLSGKGDQGKLNIQVKRQNGSLCVCLSDNGVGLQTQKIDELSQKGFGLKLVEERINILNLDGKEAKLTIKNQSNGTGTIATLIIPID